MGEPRDNLIPEDSPQPHDVQSAMAELRAALHGRKIDPICAAYGQLRQAASTLSASQLCKMIGEVLGPQAMTTIISAYSHMQCFMCSDGSVPCETCHGTGELSPGRKCPNCDGLATMPCAFCRGTNWADRESIPGEILAVVSRRQREHVQRELPVLAKIVADLTPQKADATPIQKRREIARWLSRIWARLTAVAADQDTPKDEQMKFSLHATQAEKLLEMLKDM
jgi:hypothetical protein